MQNLLNRERPAGEKNVKRILCGMKPRACGKLKSSTSTVKEEYMLTNLIFTDANESISGQNLLVSIS